MKGKDGHIHMLRGKVQDSFTLIPFSPWLPPSQPSWGETLQLHHHHVQAFPSLLGPKSKARHLCQRRLCARTLPLRRTLLSPSWRSGCDEQSTAWNGELRLRLLVYVLRNDGYGGLRLGPSSILTLSSLACRNFRPHRGLVSHCCHSPRSTRCPPRPRQRSGPSRSRLA